MLLKTLIDMIHRIEPQLLDTITIEEVVLFCTVGSDLVFRAENALGLDSETRPLEYLIECLPESLHNSIYLLWNLSYSFLGKCYINIQEKSAKNGILPQLLNGQLPVRVPQVFLLPPVGPTCPECRSGKKMTVKSSFGYLYDIDGCQTVQHYSY